MTRINHSYYVVMIDYGKRGREAIVDPEITRSEVVSRIASGDYDNIVFIHFVEGTSVEDVTDDLCVEGINARTNCWPLLKPLRWRVA